MTTIRKVRCGDDGFPIFDLGKFPGDWAEQALCAQVDAELFFPEKGETSKAAKRICARCPVIAECLEWAVSNHERFGVAGGLSERERRKLYQATDLDDFEDDPDEHGEAA